MDNPKHPAKSQWYPGPPAAPDAIEALVAESGLELPADYLKFLASFNGCEGSLGAKLRWFQLWPVEEILQLNKDYEVQKWVPGFFGIGSDGGGYLLAFDTRTSWPWEIVKVPFGYLDKVEATLVAASFNEFVKSIGQVTPN